MKTYAAKQAKDQFGRLLDDARREPVTIEKNGRPVAVILSVEDFARLEAMEDAVWGMRAELAAKEGYIGAKESAAYLKAARHAKD